MNTENYSLPIPAVFSLWVLFFMTTVVKKFQEWCAFDGALHWPAASNCAVILGKLCPNGTCAYGYREPGTESWFAKYRTKAEIMTSHLDWIWNNLMWSSYSQISCNEYNAFYHLIKYKFEAGMLSIFQLNVLLIFNRHI